jgi:hypothetical protein
MNHNSFFKRHKWIYSEDRKHRHCECGSSEEYGVVSNAYNLDFFVGWHPTNCEYYEQTSFFRIVWIETKKGAAIFENLAKVKKI